MDFVHQTTLFTLHIRKWSGKVTAEDADYNPAGELPPAKLLERGRKPIFPPKALTVFDALRKQAETVLLEKGVRHMKGYAVHNDYRDEAVTKLTQIQSKYNESLEAVITNFDSYRHEWLDQNREFEKVIDRYISKESVHNRFSFEFYLSQIEPIPGFEMPQEKISNQVLHEVGQLCKLEADRLVERKGLIRGEELRNKLNPMIEKLDILSFGDSRVLKLLSEFKILQAAIPLEANESMPSAVITFLSTCSSANRLESVITGNFSVSDMLIGMNVNSVVKEAQQQPTLAHVGAYF